MKIYILNINDDLSSSNKTNLSIFKFILFIYLNSTFHLNFPFKIYSINSYLSYNKNIVKLSFDKLLTNLIILDL